MDNYYRFEEGVFSCKSTLSDGLPRINFKHIREEFFLGKVQSEENEGTIDEQNRVLVKLEFDNSSSIPVRFLSLRSGSKGQIFHDSYKQDNQLVK